MSDPSGVSNMSDSSVQGTSSRPDAATGVSYDFSGAVVLVTGAARGMGRDLVQRFSLAGASVMASDVAPESVEGLDYATGTADDLAATVDQARALGGAVEAAHCDVRVEEQVENLVDATVARFGRLDILISNAGVFTGAPIAQLTEQAWDAAIDVNLKGSFLCAKHASRHMSSRPGGGRIVTISSTSALVGIPNQASYQASKHGVVGLTRTLALELAPHGVTVNTVCPTVVYTPMLDHLVSMGAAYFQEVSRLCGASTVFPGLDALDCRDVSEAVLWLASDAARYVTGIALPVDGGFTCK